MDIDRPLFESETDKNNVIGNGSSRCVFVCVLEEGQGAPVVSSNYFTYPLLLTLRFTFKFMSMLVEEVNTMGNLSTCFLL